MAKLFPEHIGNNYHIIRCNFTDMTSCIEAATNLKDYQANHFINGVSFWDNVVPLGIGFTQWKPIETLGLKAPPSLVTNAVIEARYELVLTVLNL